MATTRRTRRSFILFSRESFLEERKITTEQRGGLEEGVYIPDPIGQLFSLIIRLLVQKMMMFHTFYIYKPFVTESSLDRFYYIFFR